MRARIGHEPGVLSALLVALLLLGSAACSDEGGSEAGGDEVEAGRGSSVPEESPDAPSTGVSDPEASAGCGSSEVASVVEEQRTLDVGGTERRYLLTVPSTHDGREPLPIVFDFHGLMEGSEIHAGMTEYSTLAEEEGFVAVFAHGTGEPVRWNANPDADQNIDLAFFDALVEQLGSELCIDMARVYSTGLSNGAMFTSTLVCERADVLAAAAPVAGITFYDGCDPARPVPVVAFHGTEDPILLFNGGVDMSVIPGGDAGGGPATTAEADLDGEGYPAQVAALAESNGCDPSPIDTEVTAEVVHRVYDCPDGADVEFYIVIGGGHSWPGSEFSQSIADIVGYTTFDIDATRDAWEFMSRFTNR